MSISTNKKVWKIMALIFLALSLLFLSLFYFKTLFITFILGGALILVIERMTNDYKERMKKYNIKGKWVTIIGYFLFFFWAFVVIFAIGASISDFGEVVEKIGARDETFSNFYQSQIEPRLPDIFEERLINEDLVRNLESWIIHYLTVIISNLSVLLFHSVLIIPLMINMYFRKRKVLEEQICNLVPEQFRDSFSNALKDVSKQLHDFFAAKAIESIAVASICCLGFYVAGLKGWLVLGILVGVMNIIPYLGPILGALPPLLLGFIDQPIVAVYVLITIIIAQLIDNFYLIPFMITRKVSVDPLLGIVIIFVSAQLFGLMGMVFGIPIYLVYKIVLREAYRNLINIYEKTPTKKKTAA